MGTQWRRLHQHWQQNTLTGRLHQHWQQNTLTGRLHQQWQQNTLTGRLHQQWQQNTLTGRKTGYASFCTKVREFLKSWITNRDKKKLYWHEFVETWKENQTEIGYIVLLGSIIGCPPLLAVWSICRTERACWSWRVWAKQLDSLHENVFIEHNWTFCKLELSGLYRFCGSGGSSVGVCDEAIGRTVCDQIPWSKQIVWAAVRPDQLWSNSSPVPSEPEIFLRG